jgi:hypothetical protein
MKKTIVWNRVVDIRPVIGQKVLISYHPGSFREAVYVGRALGTLYWRDTYSNHSLITPQFWAEIPTPPESEYTRPYLA